MDRTPYQLPFTLDLVPAWACPTCRLGRLTLDPKAFRKYELPESVKQRKKNPDWEPDWCQYVFACVFVCNDPKCGEPVACSGTGDVDTFEYDDDEHGWVQTTQDRFTPKHFEPALVLMDIPKKCPDAVHGQLLDSFALFHLDPGASLNAARTAIEALLTALGVKRFGISKLKKRTFLTLHSRIDLLPPKHKELVEPLLAMKWLGNAGSHAGANPTTSDVRMMYDLLEHALSEIYEGKSVKLKALAKKIIKKKGPVK